jgi:cytochrome c553
MRQRVRANRWKKRGASIAVAAVILFAPMSLLADDFSEELERVDRVLNQRPSKILPQALEACRHRRNDAVRLYQAGHIERAERRLKYCTQVLKTADLPRAPVPRAAAPPSMEEMQARAALEVEQALALPPDVKNGLKIYRGCAACHMPEGWGLTSGMVPQIAGQHRRVIIKQLADIRAGYRENVLMVPYSSVESIGGTQSVADVAGYIDTLEMSVENGKGSGEDLELGARLYRENCARCHGNSGEGDAEAYVPRIQAQHYAYLVRQFEAIRDGKRRNANPEMVAQIRAFEARETQAVLDYVSRLEPPEDFRAPAGWHNPDFAD